MGRFSIFQNILDKSSTMWYNTVKYIMILNRRTALVGNGDSDGNCRSTLNATE